jgi:hypothetical protein
MKAKLAAFVAVSLIGFSSLSSAQDALSTRHPAPDNEPVMLSGVEMDEVTAAGHLVKTGEIQIIGDVTVKDNVNGNNINVTVLDGVSIQRQSV